MRETQQGNGSHQLSIAAAASSWLQAWIIIAMVLMVLVATPARADQWSLLINGKSVHLDEQPGVDFNEENWGLGVQYDLDITPRKWVPFVNASGLKDSNGNASYYAGGGTVRRFTLGKQKGSSHLDAGLVAFLMVRKEFRNGDPFLGILPVVSFGTDRIALNVTYIPKVDPKMVPIVFLQLKIGLH